jgi:excisionase family DNA binding protein
MSSNIQVSRVCEYCKVDFAAKKTTTRFCSAKCNNAALKMKGKEEKVIKSDAETTIIKFTPILETMMKAYYTIDDLSQIFGMSKRTFYRIIDRGELPSAKLGSKTFVQKEAIENLFKKKNNGD